MEITMLLGRVNEKRSGCPFVSR